MLKVFNYADATAEVSAAIYSVELNFDMRKRSRFLAETSCGQEIGFLLEHGNSLHAGDMLVTETGETVCIEAAIEPVTTVTCEDSLTLLKTAFHLGNRHVPLQINHSHRTSKRVNWLRYLEDYVLDDMVLQLGAHIVHENRPFHPESGAYASNGKVAGGHSHSADEGHATHPPHHHT